VTTFYGRPLSSPFSGNVIDVCPVGSLTSSPFRFKARSWELKRVPGICTLCGVGCNLTLDAKSNRLLRVTSRENLDVNDEWLCDRGRFGQDYVNSEERLATPMIRRDGKLEPASWDEALTLAAKKLEEIARTANPDVVAAVGSARSSNETNYLLQKWARSVAGTNNVDFAGRPPDSATPLSSVIAPLRAVAVVLVGVDTLGDAPIVELFIRRAALTKGTRVIAIGPKRPVVSRYGLWLGCRAGTEGAVLAGLLHLLARDKRTGAAGGADLTGWTKEYAPERVAELSGVDPAVLKQAADILAEKGTPLVLHGDGVAIPLVRNLAVLLGGEAAYLTPHANAWGALLMGVAPDRYAGGLSVEDTKARDSFGKRWDARLSPRGGLAIGGILAGAREGKVQAMVVVESDLVSQCPEAAASLPTLRFLAVVDHFLTPTAQLADVVFPSAAPAEADGTYLNMTRRLQLSPQAVYPLKGVRPAWQTIAALAEAMQDESKKRSKDGQWDYNSASAVWHEITRGVALCRECAYETIGTLGWQPEMPAEKVKLAPFALELPAASQDYPLVLAVGRILFNKSALLRHSAAIPPNAPEATLFIHPKDAEAQGIKTGDAVLVTSPRGSLSLRAQVSEDVAPGCVWAALDVSETPLSAILEVPGKVTRVKIDRS